MKKLLKNIKAAYKEPTGKHIDVRRPNQGELLDPKYVVVNPPNPPVYPDNKGAYQAQDNAGGVDGDVGTFSGFGSWMASFEPDPAARGVVEVATAPVYGDSRAVSEELLMEGEWGHYQMIKLTLQGVKKPASPHKFAVLINGPWFMTLAQVNRLLDKHGYVPVLSAKHGDWAARNWDGDQALPTALEIPVIDGQSRYDAPQGEGPMMGRNEQFGPFLANLRRLRVQCEDGRVLVKSFPGELEITFNRTLRLPEDGKTHHQPVRLGKIAVNSISGVSKKLEASGNPSLLEMARKGGVFFPLYQREAMFLSFKARQDAFAVRVFVGGVNAVSGLPWNSNPSYKSATQDYLSIPPQQFLDGVCVAKDVVKQFIAMPLGSGYSVEKQVTGKETVGGMQLEIIPGNRWSLFVPASPNLPQPGPYYPEPTQTAGSVGVAMVVMGSKDSASLVRGESYHKDKDMHEELMDRSRFPVYLRHLYQSQIEGGPKGYAHGTNAEDFYPGMSVRMTAVYLLEVTLQYTSKEGTYGQQQSEKVHWAPWWTLHKCISEYEKLDSERMGNPVATMEFYHQGRRLFPGLSLQEQSVTDGAVIVVQRQTAAYGYGYNPQPYSAGEPLTYQYQQQQYPPSYQAPVQSSPPPQQQYQHSSPSPYPSYDSPAPSYGSPVSQVSPPSTYYSPPPPEKLEGRYMYEESQSYAPATSAAPGPASALPPRMSAPTSMWSGAVQQQAMPQQSSPPQSISSPPSYFSDAAPSASPSSPPSYPSGPPRATLPQPPQTVAPSRPQAQHQQLQQQDQTGWAMGIAAGSKIRQAILADPFAPTAWSKERATMLSVQILNSVAFESLTGMMAPWSPITPQMYVEQGLPFLASYQEGIDTDGAANLAGLKGVGDIDAAKGPVRLGSNVASARNVGCTCCGKMLCDSILRPCNHAFCSSCIKQYMTFQYSPGFSRTACRICNTQASKLVGFSAPMALPGEDVVDLSDANIITTPPYQGSSSFQSVYELSAAPGGESYTKGSYSPYEMQA